MVSTPQPCVINDNVTRVDLEHSFNLNLCFWRVIWSPHAGEDVADHTGLGSWTNCCSGSPSEQGLSSSVATWLQGQTSNSNTNHVTNFDTWVTVGSLESGHSDTKDYLTVFVYLNCLTQLVDTRLHNYVVNFLKFGINGSGTIRCWGNINLFEGNFIFWTRKIVASFVGFVFWYHQSILAVRFNDVWLFSNYWSLGNIAVSSWAISACVARCSNTAQMNEGPSPTDPVWKLTVTVEPLLLTCSIELAFDIGVS